MNDDYLWDGSGPVDEDVRALEETLAGLAYQPSAAPLLAPKRAGWRAATVGALALAAAAALWFSVRAPDGRILAEPPSAAEVPTVLAGAQSAGPPRGVLTGPFSPNAAAPGGSPRPKAAGSGVLDPWGDSERALEPSAVQRVVSSRKGELHRQCYAPARAKRTPNAPESVRLGTRLKIAQDGRVTSAVTTGDDRGYPGLSVCVSKLMRTWRFPVSKHGGTVQVPFVFRNSDDDGLIEPFKTAPAPPPNNSKPKDPWKPPAASDSDLMDKMRKSAARSSDPKLLNPWEDPPTSKPRLSSAQISGVVSLHRGSLHRSCWMPAQQRGQAPTSARVQLSLRIAPSGVVSGAEAADPPGYPGMGACVASRARAWRFPQARGSTTVNVPFVFSRTD